VKKLRFYERVLLQETVRSYEQARFNEYVCFSKKKLYHEGKNFVVMM
jgi:hypothetical protein